MKILTDTPGVTTDCMDFSQLAAVFKKIVEDSPPRFTIGIFGEWGAGKTTLMNMVYELLDKDDRFITVKFNPWRYERDKHLMIPLLQTIRMKLNSRFANSGEEQRKASRISEVIQAIARGFEGEFSLGIPLAGKAKIKLNPAMWLSREKEATDLVTYYEVVNHLEEIPKNRGIVRPFVIFVDDLDRCFSSKALEIIESIKAFFDLNGYIFVLGLDVRALKSYITEKYGSSTIVTAEDYIEKIIQLPFFIPPMSSQQVETAIKSLGLDPDELIYLERFSQGIPGNIRKMKRLVNSYRIIKNTTGADMDNEVLMKLLILQFRWPDYYAELVDKKFPFYSNTVKYISGYDENRVRFLQSYAAEEVPLLTPEDRDQYTSLLKKQKEFEQKIQWYEKIDALMENRQLRKYFIDFIVEGIDDKILEEYIHKSRTSYIEEPSSNFESFTQKEKMKQSAFGAYKGRVD